MQGRDALHYSCFSECLIILQNLSRFSQCFSKLSQFPFKYQNNKPFSQLHLLMDLLPAGAMTARFQIGLQISPISPISKINHCREHLLWARGQGSGHIICASFQNHLWPPSKVLFGLRSTSLVRKLTSTLILRKKLLNKSFLLIP